MKLNIPKISTSSEEDCRAVCLKQVLDYFGISSKIEEINNYCKDTVKFRDWDYYLGEYAISKGLNVKIHTRSLSIFDSTWFPLPTDELIEKILLKKKRLEDLATQYHGFQKFALEAKKAIDFLIKGGNLSFAPFSKELIEDYISRRIPIIATLTGQLLYELPKTKDGIENDIEGDPWKHTVVISGNQKDKYLIEDPSKITGKSKYQVKKDMLLDSIVRYDSNLIIVYKK